VQSPGAEQHGKRHLRRTAHRTCASRRRACGSSRGAASSAPLHCCPLAPTGSPQTRTVRAGALPCALSVCVAAPSPLPGAYTARNSRAKCLPASCRVSVRVSGSACVYTSFTKSGCNLSRRLSELYPAPMSSRAIRKSARRYTARMRMRHAHGALSVNSRPVSPTQETRCAIREPVVLVPQLCPGRRVTDDAHRQSRP